MILCTGDRHSQEAWLQQQSAESSMAKQQCSQWRTLFRRLCWQQLKWGSCKEFQVRTGCPSIRLSAVNHAHLGRLLHMCSSSGAQGRTRLHVLDCLLCMPVAPVQVNLWPGCQS